jgi:hypothetical protein
MSEISLLFFTWFKAILNSHFHCLAGLVFLV